MNININDFENLVSPYGKAAWTVLMPFIPALVRSGPEVYEGFIAHLNDADWESIDKLMYARMTVEERRQLEDQVYQDAYDAVLAHHDQVELIKNLALQMFIKLAMLAVV